MVDHTGEEVATGAGRFPILPIVVFSVFANLLMLTGPIFMLQVYDRVLISRSQETLAALVLLTGFLYAVMAALDIARGRIMARIGARYQDRLDARILSAGIAGGDGRGVRDLELIRQALGSAGLLAVLDLPWVPVFLGLIFLFHPLLGGLAAAGGGAIIALTLAARRMTAGPLHESAIAARRADRQEEEMRTAGELIGALGMQVAMTDRWRRHRRTALAAAVRAAERGLTVGSLTRAFRLFLQSAMLGLAAWLVLGDRATAGVMVASSILLGRALAPVESVLAQWPLLHEAREAHRRIARVPDPAPRPMPLPPPGPRVELRNLTILPPGADRAALRGISLTLAGGEALGVIGPSGSGKSTLARALAGVWPAAAGEYRLGGATPAQYGADMGRHVGYLPQRILLFEGTVAENIARFAPGTGPAQVLAAAAAAEAHEMILRLPLGYDTAITASGAPLSGGQAQRIALARALFGAPPLIVLDEPDSALDQLGEEGLALAIRRMKAQGNAVVVMAHRLATVRDCDRLLVLEDGAAQLLGPREAVLRQMMAGQRPPRTGTAR